MIVGAEKENNRIQQKNNPCHFHPIFCFLKQTTKQRNTEKREQDQGNKKKKNKETEKSKEEGRRKNEKKIGGKKARWKISDE